MFRPVRIYIKLSRDHVEITNLGTGETAAKRAINSFSGLRSIVGSFHHAHETIEAVLKELGIRAPLFSSIKALIQQREGMEGGLSDIEKRALRDLAEMAGARTVLILGFPDLLSWEEAIAVFDTGGKDVFV